MAWITLPVVEFKALGTISKAVEVSDAWFL